jgi:hypothetical protein
LSPARLFDCTSPSHPSFTPSNPKKLAWFIAIGVGRTSQLDGLLIVLPDADKGGVDG